jgi:hypothetical protein
VKDTTSANIDQQSAVLQSLSGGGSDGTLDESAQTLALDLLVSVSGGGAAVGLLPSSIGAMGSTVDSLLAATSDNITAEFSTKVTSTLLFCAYKTSSPHDLWTHALTLRV